MQFKFIVDRLENKNSEMNVMSSKEQLLDYLNEKYFLFNNVVFLQGLFLACEAPELYEICLKYAKTEEQNLIYIKKKILEKGKN